MADLITSHLLDRLADLALEADPTTRAALAALDGKRLRFVCTAPPIDTTLCFTPNGVTIAPQATEGNAALPSHALLRGSAADFWKLFSGGDVGQLQLEGDITLLQKFATAIKGYQPNLPPLPAAISGNPQAAAFANDVQQLMNTALGTAAEGLSLFGSAINASRAQAQQDFSERFTQESELDEFLARLHRLRLNVDRLQARIELLETP